MASENTGRRKFAKLVTDHLLGDIDRNELVSVMHSDRMADEVR